MKVQEFLIEIAKESNFSLKIYKAEEQSFESFLDSNNEFFNLSRKILLYLNHYVKYDFSGQLIEFNVGYYKIPTNQYANYYSTSQVDEAVKLSIDYPSDFLKVIKFIFLYKKDLNEYKVDHKIVLNSYFAIKTFFGSNSGQVSQTQMIEQSKGELYMKYLRKPPVYSLLSIHDELILGSSIANATLISYFKYLVLKDLARDENYEQGQNEFQLLANHTLELLNDIPSLPENQ